MVFMRRASVWIEQPACRFESRRFARWMKRRATAERRATRGATRRRAEPREGIIVDRGARREARATRDDDDGTGDDDDVDDDGR